eukprot:CCRYP_006901-RD/>CCRYP_006901-RD protein AED:0.46 eAED:0.46 QI:0/-1/0/1/-1/0/1/0/41
MILRRSRRLSCPGSSINQSIRRFSGSSICTVRCIRIVENTS